MKNLKLFFSLAFMLFLTCCYSQKAYETATYKGKVGKYKIIMEIVHGDNFYGDYFYLSKNKKISFSAEETIQNGKIILYEKVNDVKTGFFVFKSIDFEKNSLSGKWFSIDGSKSYDVILYKIKT